MLEFSPTLDARWCYLIVLVCALISANSQLRGRLEVLKEKVIYSWSLLSTWGVFTVYLAIPLVLFWFLDRAAAIHDTSLFAALLVGLAYPAVLAGSTGVKPVQGLSGVFDWLNKVTDSLVKKTTVKVTLQAQLFERAVLDYLEHDANGLVETTALALRYADAPAQLTASLAAAATSRAKAQLVYDAATGSAEGLKPITKVLEELKPTPKISSPYRLALRWAAAYALLVSLAAAIAIVVAFTGARESFLMWRVVKPGVTEVDLHRTRDALRESLKVGSKSAGHIRSGLAEALQEPGLESNRTDQILQLLLAARGSTNDLEFKQTALLLTAALRFGTVDVRVRIHHALLLLAREVVSPDDEELKALAKWTPIATESLTDLEAKWRAWEVWWQAR